MNARLASLKYFTVAGDFRALVADGPDPDPEPEVVPITGTVTFTPLLNSGDAILAAHSNPPTVFVPAPIVAAIDADGVLKLRAEPDVGSESQFAPVRLLADQPLLELSEPLFYRVDFSSLRFYNRPGNLSSFTFQAPNTDTVINLVSCLRSPGVVASGITKVAPSGVRLLPDGKHIQFSFGGVDIPDPVRLEVVAGATGDPGPQGPQGPSGTVTVGAVDSGDVAAVVNTGTPENSVLAFTLPRGDQGVQGVKGDTGPPGPQGVIGPAGPIGPQGVQGVAGEPGAGLQLSGEVATYALLPVLTPADAGKAFFVREDGKLYVWSGSAWPAQGAGSEFRGPQGVPGVTGPAGPQGLIGPAGAAGPQGLPGPAGVDGVAGAVGPAGSAATVAVGSVSTGAPGSAAAVVNAGSSSAARFDFTVPQGPVGPAGTTDWLGITNKPAVVLGSNAGVALGLVLWVGTQAQYDAIGSKSSTTVYVVVA